MPFVYLILGKLSKLFFGEHLGIWRPYALGSSIPIFILLIFTLLMILRIVWFLIKPKEIFINLRNTSHIINRSCFVNISIWKARRQRLLTWVVYY